MVAARTLALALSLCGCHRVFGVEPPDDAVLTPTFVGAASLYSTQATGLSYSSTTPDGSGRVLVVMVQLGSKCDPPTPNVSGVTYAGMPLAQIASILGTPCGLQATRSEQWLLVDPPVGTADVIVTLDGEALSVHSGALSFIDVDTTDPVRAVATGTNTGSTSTVTVTSATGDLVLCTVGHGSGITGPGGDAMPSFVNNVDISNTLNNAGASTMPGDEPIATSTWTFQTIDEWQSIATSLRRRP